MLTYPRQVRLQKCAIYSPSLPMRADSAVAAQQLEKDGYDITPFVQKIDLFESIFDNTISGKITLYENIGLIEYLPIVGIEVLGIVFSVDYTGESGKVETKTFRKSFRIVKVGDQAFPKHDYRMYVLDIVTPEFVASVSSRIARPFRNMTCLDAVESILKQDLNIDMSQRPFVTKEQTYGNIDILIPNYTPLRAINYFTILSQTVDPQHESNFLFFETLDGFHFTSIGKLIRDGQEHPKTFRVNPAHMSTAPILMDDVAMNAIIRIHQDQAFDLLQDISSGTLRSRMIHFDFLARKYRHTDDSRYTETFKHTTHLAKHPVYPENFDQSVAKDVRIFAVPSNMWSTKSAYVKSNDESTEQRLHESIVLRNRQLREIRHLQALIDLPGQPDLRAGTVVILNYPSTKLLQGQDVTINTPVMAEPTPLHSGAHLVASVHHILTQRGNGALEYRMNVKVCRDSLGAALPGFKPSNE